MKAVYTRINSDVYKIEQPFQLPAELTYKSPGANSVLNTDPRAGVVKQNIVINTMNPKKYKSNAQLYNELVDYLKEKQITEIDTIKDYYKVYIDYTVFQDNREIDHAQVIRPVKSTNKAFLLGVATNNECVYRQVKVFNPTIDFKMRSVVPHGIMEPSPCMYTLKINNISIFQSRHEFREVHNSIYEVPFNVPSSVINASVKDEFMIFSSFDEGIDIQPISVNFMPRAISIYLDILLSDYIVAYDEQSIIDILIENIDKKYREEEGEDIDNPTDGGDSIIPSDDPKTPADGKYEPDENGYYDWYERCRQTTPNALLVVEDLISDASYNTETMIKKSMVLADIPDIVVGEYVLYRESITSQQSGGEPSEDDPNNSDPSTEDLDTIDGDFDLVVDDEL